MTYDSYTSHGYISVHLNTKSYQKHIQIAKQFIPNDVDHYNHIRDDNHLVNLRWYIDSENAKNKSSHLGVQYEFVDEIDDESIEVTDYRNHQFENYYYEQTVDEFYFWNGKQYRKLYVNEDKRDGGKFVFMLNKKHKRVNIYFSKFKRLYDLI